MRLINKLLPGLCLTAALAAVLPASAEFEKTPAFPGAEGYGRYTTGGRGGYVYHVTNTDDSGTGSLRWALGQPTPSVIVFDVSGTIHLQSKLSFPENITIAGQTAPGDGICIADYPVQLNSNTIVRYVRFRLGNKYVTLDGADGWDGLGAMDCHDIMIDHCSVSWSIDECCSILGNVNSTLQWTIVAQSLVNAGHTKEAHGYGGNWGGTHASFHHNALIHHGSRTPRLGPRPSTQTNEIMDMRNNVIYNHSGNGCYGGEGMNVNIVSNYYRPGPASPTGTAGQRIAAVSLRTTSYCKTYPAFSPMLHVWGTYFLEGNKNHKYANVLADNWANGFYNQISNSSNDGLYTEEAKQAMHLYEPIPFTMTTTHSADKAFEKVLDYCGASLHRDSFDAAMIDDARLGNAKRTGSGLSQGLVNSQNDNKPYDAPADWSAWPTLESSAPLADTDGDGIPDEWEIAHGLNPRFAADGNFRNEEGYTNLDLYLADIVADITAAQNADGDVLGDITPEPVKGEYVISTSTNGGTDSWWNFHDYISFCNSKDDAYLTTTNGYLRMTRDAQHFISLPVGAEVYAVKLTGKGRYSAMQLGNDPGEDLVHLTEINGETIALGEKTLPNRTGKDTTIEHTLKTPARGMLSMTFAVNDPDIKELVLYTRAINGGSEVEDIYSEVLPAKVFDHNWYDLTGRVVSTGSTTPAPGLYIHEGRKVLVK